MIWKTLEAELQRGEAARAAGNEGQARVSARRAAGILLRIYLERRGEDVTGLSAFDLIEIAHVSPEFPPEVNELLSHFIRRVEQGGDFPDEIDLLADVHRLQTQLGLFPGPAAPTPTDSSP